VASDSQRYVAPRGHSGSIEHFHDFFTAVRTRGGTIEDATFGHNAAMGCHMANYAYFNKTIATWDSAANKIRGSTDSLLERFFAGLRRFPVG
jgi:hypothetical protein